MAGDTAFEAEKLGFHKLIDLSQLPIQYPGSTIIVSKPFLAAKRDVVKRFLRGWIEGIKTAKTDKEYTIKVMQKFLKTSNRWILDKTFEVYKPIHERVPSPDAKVLGAALKQLSATVPASRWAEDRRFYRPQSHLAQELPKGSLQRSMKAGKCQLGELSKTMQKTMIIILITIACSRYRGAKDTCSPATVL